MSTNVTIIRKLNSSLGQTVLGHTYVFNVICVSLRLITYCAPPVADLPVGGQDVKRKQFKKNNFANKPFILCFISRITN